MRRFFFYIKLYFFIIQLKCRLKFLKLYNSEKNVCDQ